MTKIWTNYEALSSLSWWCRSTQHGVQTTRTRGTSHYVALQTQAWTIAPALHSKGWSLAHQYRPLTSISLSWSLAELQLKSSSPAMTINLQLKLFRQQWGFLNHLKYIVIVVLCHLLISPQYYIYICYILQFLLFMWTYSVRVQYIFSFKPSSFFLDTHVSLAPTHVCLSVGP